MDGTGKSRLTNTPEYEDYPRWSPDRRAFVFHRWPSLTSNSPKIMIANADGSGLTPVDPSPNAWGPDW